MGGKGNHRHTPAQASDQLKDQVLETIMSNAAQAFFLFDRHGICLPTHSKSCLTLLDRNPNGLNVAEVLAVPIEKRATFHDWCRLLFDELIDFDELVNVGPKLYPSLQGKFINLEYKPVRGQDGRLELITVIATDRTDETRFRDDAKKMHAFGSLMGSVIKDKERFRRFVSTVRQLFRETTRVLGQKNLNYSMLNEVTRNLHTLKVSMAAFGLQQIQDAIHDLESRIFDESDLPQLQNRLAKAVPEIETAFEALLDEHREILSDVLMEKVPSRTVPIETLEEFASRLVRFTDPKMQRLYRDFVDEIVAVPMRRIFGEFDPFVQQIARNLNKRVEPIKFIGDEVSVAPESIDAFRAVLVHVFRNIVDHGIEHELTRVQREKPPHGHVVVEFRRMANDAGSYLRIIISDDGNGIDDWQIRRKLEENGESVSGLSSKQLMGRIFDPGFTTAPMVSEFSGRGVGLDAVKTEVERLGGTIGVRSEIGKGSAFIIELPLDESQDVARLRRPASAA